MRTLAIAVLIAAFVLGNLPAAFAGEWSKVGAATVVITLMAAAGWFGYAFGRGTAKHDQIVREEVDAYRELDDPDPFNTRLRISPVTRLDDTDTGETR